MHTNCIRQGQIEVGVIEHEGQQSPALGATFVSAYVTGYTRNNHGDIALTTWCGKTMLSCRMEVVERYGDSSFALMFRLPRGRFLVGYALGEHGMLFRGELLHDADEREARQVARSRSDEFAELDSEGKQWLDLEYCCPTCSHEWEEQWSCACDSQCPECGTQDISPTDWNEAD